MVPDEATHMRLTYSLASQIMGVEKDKTTLRGEEKYIYEHLPQAPNQESYDYSYTHLLSGEDNGVYLLSVSSMSILAKLGLGPTEVDAR